MPSREYEAFPQIGQRFFGTCGMTTDFSLLIWATSGLSGPSLRFSHMPLHEEFHCARDKRGGVATAGVVRILFRRLLAEASGPVAYICRHCSFSSEISLEALKADQ